MRQLIEMQFTPTDNTNIGEFQNGTTLGNNVSNLSSLRIQGAGRGFKGYVFAKEHGEWPSLSDGSYHYFPDEGYHGYMSKTLSGADLTTDVRLIFNFLGEIPKYVTLQFDRVCNEFATSITVSNNRNSTVTNINNRSYKCFIDISNFQLESNSVLTVRINSWNRAFKNVKITGIVFGYIGEYDENMLESFRCSENLLTDNFMIKAGILEQFADIILKDKYSELAVLAKAGLLNKEIKVSVWAIDDSILDEVGEPLKYLQGTYLTDTWDVDGTSSLVSLKCTDPSISFSNIPLVASTVQTRNLAEVLSLLFTFVPQFTFEFIDAETAQYCQKFLTPNSWMYAGTFEEVLVKALIFGNLRVYWYLDHFIIARCY